MTNRAVGVYLINSTVTKASPPDSESLGTLGSNYIVFPNAPKLEEKWSFEMNEVEMPAETFISTPFGVLTCQFTITDILTEAQKEAAQQFLMTFGVAGAVPVILEFAMDGAGTWEQWYDSSTTPTARYYCYVHLDDIQFTWDFESMYWKAVARCTLMGW